MRWGVGKGRFRVSAAIVKSFILAFLCWFVFLFFERVKPLTIDTSSESLTASLSKRILNSDTNIIVTKSKLTDSNIHLFLTICDSVNSYYENRTERFLISNSEKDTIKALQFSIQLQQECKKIAAEFINKEFRTVEEFHETRLKVTSILLPKDSVDILNLLDEKKLLSTCGRELKEKICSQLIKELNSNFLDTQEANLLKEYNHKLNVCLDPILLVLLDDEFSYSREVRKILGT